MLSFVKINVDDVTVIIDLDEVFTYANTFQTQNEQELRNHHICFQQINENNDFFKELFSLDTNNFQGTYIKYLGEGAGGFCKFFKNIS